MNDSHVAGVRKTYQNYFLPTESCGILKRFIGKHIQCVFAGIVSEDNELTPDAFERNSSCLVIAFCDDAALEFRLDDLAGSLTLKLHEQIENEHLLCKKIQLEDLSLPPFFRVRCLVRYPGQFPSGEIASISMYRLPENYGVLYAKSPSRNEYVVAFATQVGQEILVACRVSPASRRSPQLIEWSSVSKDFPAEHFIRSDIS